MIFRNLQNHWCDLRSWLILRVNNFCYPFLIGSRPNNKIWRLLWMEDLKLIGIVLRWGIATTMSPTVAWQSFELVRHRSSGACRFPKQHRKQIWHAMFKSQTVIARMIVESLKSFSLIELSRTMCFSDLPTSLRVCEECHGTEAQE